MLKLHPRTRCDTLHISPLLKELANQSQAENQEEGLLYDHLATEVSRMEVLLCWRKLLHVVRSIATRGMQNLQVVPTYSSL